MRGNHLHHTRAEYGGMVFEHGSKRVVYFHGTWDIDDVNRAATDINELECLSAIYCGEVADALAHRRGEHHLYQISDSEYRSR